jgi:hypothetical protein
MIGYLFDFENETIIYEMEWFIIEN